MFYFDSSLLHVHIIHAYYFGKFGTKELFNCICVFSNKMMYIDKSVTLLNKKIDNMFF